MHTNVPPPAPDRTRDGLILAACAALVAAAILISALVPGAHHATAATLKSFERDAACAEWTDSCVVCTRTPGGPACSLPGIACQAGPARCLRRAGA